MIAMTRGGVETPRLAAWLAATAATLLAGCGGGSEGSTGSSATAPASSLSPAAELGDTLFSDTSLSASGKQACATCHVPTHAYAATDGLSVPLGGVGMDLPGFRNAPSLVYASF